MIPFTLFLQMQASPAGVFDVPWWAWLVVAVLCLFGAGWRFFAHVFQVYFLPHITLRRVAEDEHFFYSLVLAIAGAAFLILGLSLALPSLDKVSSNWIGQTVTTKVTGSSVNYRGMAQDQAKGQLTGLYDQIFHTNIYALLFLPVFFWLIFMSLVWVFAKLFHTPVTYAHFLRTTAYNALLFGLAGGAMLYYEISTMAGESIPAWVMPVAWILAVYALVHLYISLAQGLDISPAGIIVSLLLAAAIIGGIGYGVVYQWGIPAWDNFWAQINAFDPSRMGG